MQVSFHARTLPRICGEGNGGHRLASGRESRGGSAGTVSVPFQPLAQGLNGGVRRGCNLPFIRSGFRVIRSLLHHQGCRA